VFPIVEVVNATSFAAKIILVTALANLLGWLSYALGKRRTVSDCGER
jgi:hypothetical protein